MRLGPLFGKGNMFFWGFMSPYLLELWELCWRTMPVFASRMQHMEWGSKETSGTEHWRLDQQELTWLQKTAKNRNFRIFFVFFWFEETWEAFLLWTFFFGGGRGGGVRVDGKSTSFWGDSFEFWSICSTSCWPCGWNPEFLGELARATTSSLGHRKSLPFTDICVYVYVYIFIF